MNKKISELIKNLPDKPGVYIMHDKDDMIIYIGKAKNLKNRVSQYFIGAKSLPTKVMKMAQNVNYFEYIITASELEALILENNLIKKHKPKYNILLKDDKTYPYLCVDIKSDYPKLSLTRKRLNDQKLYFGPFSSAINVREIIKNTNSIFGLYSCNLKFGRDIGKKRECLNYHIGKCCGVCRGEISKEEYREKILKAVKFLKGDYVSLLSSLNKNMQAYSENLEFEKAAKIRDTIKSIEKLRNNQIIQLSPNENFDVVSSFTIDDKVCFCIMFIRNGILVMRENEIIKSLSEKGELMHEFLSRYYSARQDKPKTIYVDVMPDDAYLLNDFLKVNIKSASKGKKKLLIEMAQKNAEDKLLSVNASAQKTTKFSIALMQFFKAKTPIKRIEMYDISNYNDDCIVGGMIVWQDGSFKKSQYKKFNINGVTCQNDIEATREMIARRLLHLKNGDKGFEIKPDVILMDGSLAHVNAAKSVLEDDILVFGLVKNQNHKTRAIINENGQEKGFEKNDMFFSFFTALQDEVHRFAISHMHRKKSKKMIESNLTKEINGLGKTTYKALMDRFLTIDNLKNATVYEIASTKKISYPLAKRIFNYFNGEEK